MDAPLAQCTREEQCAVVRFLWSEGSSGTKIHQRLLAQYGDNALSKTTVYEWIEKFKTGRTSVKHAEGAGRPSTSTSEEKIEQAQQMILANRRITIDEVAQSLQISFGSAQEIIHEILGYNKVSARWVPRQLTEEHKRRRMEICQTLLNRYNNEGEAFLSRIVTEDESWVRHYSPETKRQSLEWKHPSSPVKKKFKSQLSAGKVMLTIFWDSKGPILEDFLEKGSTINSASYCDLLANRLKPAIRTKRRGLLSKKVLLQHDNARPHVAKATIETINKLGFEVLEHPAYSPDLAPSNYHLFVPLKDALRGRKFSSDESVQKAVHQWLCDQPKTFFSDGIYKLVDRWNKCIEMGGDYVEK